MKLDDGTEIAFRSLSRAEAITLRTFVGREDEAEVYMIAAGTDVPIEDAQAWYAATASEDVGRLVEAVAIFSGLATAESIAAANARGDAVTTGDGADPK